MSKIEIVDKKSEVSILEELTLLSKISHPFIINIHFAFQDTEFLFLVSDYLEGGDLRFQLTKNKTFSENQTKFFIANLLLSLDYLHTNNIIHRDIKPENLIFEKNGYMRLTDFGIAKKFTKNNKEETSGTPGYMAPEVLFAQNHTFAVDYFAVGVIIYEIMFGHRPYTGLNRKDLKEEMFGKKVFIDKKDIPKNWTEDSASFVNKLLIRKATDRLGYNGSKEVFQHSWLKYYPWNDLYNKKIEAPFVPENSGDNFDYNFVNNFKGPNNSTLERYKIYLKDEKTYFKIFNKYFYYYNEFDDFDVANCKIKKFVNSQESYLNKNNNDNNLDENCKENDENIYIKEDDGFENKINNINIKKIRKKYFDKDKTNLIVNYFSNQEIKHNIDKNCLFLNTISNEINIIQKIKNKSNNKNILSGLTKTSTKDNNNENNNNTNNSNYHSNFNKNKLINEFKRKK